MSSANKELTMDNMDNKKKINYKKKNKSVLKTVWRGFLWLLKTLAVQAIVITVSAVVIFGGFSRSNWWWW